MTDLELLNAIRDRLVSVERELIDLNSLRAEHDQLRSLKAVYQHRLGLTDEEEAPPESKPSEPTVTTEQQQDGVPFTQRLEMVVADHPGMDFGRLYEEVSRYLNPGVVNPRKNVSSVVSTLVKRHRIRKSGDRFYPAK